MNKKKNRTYRFGLDPAIIKSYEGIAIENKTGRILGIKEDEIAPLSGQCTINMHYKRDSGKPKHLQQFCIDSTDIDSSGDTILNIPVSPALIISRVRRNGYLTRFFGFFKISYN